MYAIIDDGGKQLRVEEGQSVDLDYREAVTIGDELELNRVLAIAGENGLELGHPAVDGAKVTAEVLGIEQGPKIQAQKFRRRKKYRPRTGHRQLYTRVRISKIESQGTESHGTESQGMESQGTESQGMESQGTESQGTESQGMEGKQE